MSTENVESVLRDIEGLMVFLLEIIPKCSSNKLMMQRFRVKSVALEKLMKLYRQISPKRNG